MAGRGGTVAAPSQETIRRLRSAEEELRNFPALPGERPGSRDPAEVLRRCEATLSEVRTELERLVPWFNEFVGSSLVVTLAKESADEAGQELELHLHRLHEDPRTVIPLLGRTVRLVAARLESIVELLPGHVDLADRRNEQERPLTVRVAAMPRRLRIRYYLGIALGAFLLLSVLAVSVVLVVPGVSKAIGVSSLLDHYAAQYAGIVVVALLFLSGVRLILGSVWLRRSIRILPQYEEHRVQEAEEGIRQREAQVLDEISPRAK